MQYRMIQWNIKLGIKMNMKDYMTDKIWHNLGHKFLSSTTKKKGISPKKANSYNWDYNTLNNFQLCVEYGHSEENCIRAHLRGKSKNWMNRNIVFYSYHKIRHLRRNYRTRAPTPNNEWNMENENLIWNRN